jgi:hypothetical protein
MNWLKKLNNAMTKIKPFEVALPEARNITGFRRSLLTDEWNYHYD